MSGCAYIDVLPAAASVHLLITDFSRRRITVSGLVVFAACSFSAAAFAYPFRLLCLQVGINCGLLSLLALFLWGYFRLRYDLPFRGFRHFLGSGDLVFLAVTTPLFAPAAFLRFQIVACLLALVWWFVAGRKRRRTIPFAGMLAITLWGFLLHDIICLWLA